MSQPQANQSPVFLFDMNEFPPLPVRPPGLPEFRSIVEDELYGVVIPDLEKQLSMFVDSYGYDLGKFPNIIPFCGRGICLHLEPRYLKPGILCALLSEAVGVFSPLFRERTNRTTVPAQPFRLSP